MADADVGLLFASRGSRHSVDGGGGRALSSAFQQQLPRYSEGSWLGRVSSGGSSQSSCAFDCLGCAAKASPTHEADAVVEHVRMLLREILALRRRLDEKDTHALEPELPTPALITKDIGFRETEGGLEKGVLRRIAEEASTVAPSDTIAKEDKPPAALYRSAGGGAAAAATVAAEGGGGGVTTTAPATTTTTCAPAAKPVVHQATDLLDLLQGSLPAQPPDPFVPSTVAGQIPSMLPHSDMPPPPAPPPPTVPAFGWQQGAAAQLAQLTGAATAAAGHERHNEQRQAPPLQDDHRHVSSPAPSSPSSPQGRCEGWLTDDGAEDAADGPNKAAAAAENVNLLEQVHAGPPTLQAKTLPMPGLLRQQQPHQLLVEDQLQAAAAAAGGGAVAELVAAAVAPAAPAPEPGPVPAASPAQEAKPVAGANARRVSTGSSGSSQAVEQQRLLNKTSMDLQEGRLPHSEAARRFSELIEDLQPGKLRASALLNRAHCHVGLGQHERALEDIDAILREKAPGFDANKWHKVWLSRGGIRRKMAQALMPTRHGNNSSAAPARAAAEALCVQAREDYQHVIRIEPKHLSYVSKAEKGLEQIEALLRSLREGTVAFPGRKSIAQQDVPSPQFGLPSGQPAAAHAFPEAAETDFRPGLRLFFRACAHYVRKHKPTTSTVLRVGLAQLIGCPHCSKHSHNTSLCPRHLSFNMQSPSRILRMPLTLLLCLLRRLVRLICW
eukprot:TRINITY_DN13787_c0_g1_i1.p1 TRINITY_DN13787_c0_g1~~TRINITY_DN13787_c0_g1_i1.p1  ORF type:complete len:725 (+),score=164.93 TRINITY_DN13787_c0_g1_i1:92-2266(+)